MNKKFNINLDKEKLPPPGIIDFLVQVPIFENDSRTDEERLYDKEERKFEIKAILTKEIKFSGPTDLDIDEAKGTSFFKVPEDAIKIKIFNNYGTYWGTKNKDNEISAFLGDVNSTNWNKAVRLFIEAISPMLDYFSYVANCPILIAKIYCHDTKNNIELFSYTVPYSEVNINPHIDSLPEELIPIFALYREAKNNHSPFYRFLCYYKILEGVLKNIRPKLFKKLKNQGIQFNRLEELVPQHTEIEGELLKLIGKNIQNVFEDYFTKKYRNVVAHFIVKDGRILNVSEFQSNTEFNTALLLIELCSRKVIENQLYYFKLKGN